MFCFFCGKTPETLLPFKKLSTSTQTFKTRLAYHPLWLTLLENDHISLLNMFGMFESMILRHFPWTVGYQDADGLVSNVTFVDQDIIGVTVWLSGLVFFFLNHIPKPNKKATSRKMFLQCSSWKNTYYIFLGSFPEIKIEPGRGPQKETHLNLGIWCFSCPFCNSRNSFSHPTPRNWCYRIS